MIEAFGWEPWPHWIFKLEDGTRIEQELFVSKGQRDGCYHQGTVWPWLIGPFVEAWVRVRGGTDDAKREARGKFLAPILAHLEEAGLGHISEIADAQPPHTPRGCPFQAWSVGEALRLDRVVLCETPVIDTKRKSVSKRSQEPIAA